MWFCFGFVVWFGFLVGFFFRQIHKTSPWAKRKAGKSVQSQSWFSKWTYLFFHKETWIVEQRQHEFICSAPGGILQSSQPLNQKCLSCTGHNISTRYFKGESAGAGISFEAESKICSLADCRRNELATSASFLVSQVFSCSWGTTHDVFLASQIVLSLSILPGD